MVEISLPRNTAIVLCGAAGSGKSTFAAKHFLPTEIVSSDECRALISDDPSNQAVSPEAFQLMHYIVEKRLRVGRLTVADATHLTREERRPLLRITRRFGFNAAILIFDVPVELCLARNARRERVVPQTALRSQHALVERTLKAIDEESFNYIFVIDELTQNEVRFEFGRRISRRPRRPAR